MTTEPIHFDVATIFSVRTRRVYEDKTVFDGFMLNGLRHGEGKLQRIDGTKYEGNFAQDVYEGEGLLQFPSNHSKFKQYKGTFKNGKYHGEGVLLFQNGDVYCGSFASGVYCGTGELQTNNGIERFQGNWRHGRPFGFMFVITMKGDQYKGQMDGTYHGVGKLIYNNNFGFYDGEWKYGKYHGHGIRVYMNGNRYEGNFVDGVIEGKGKMSFARSCKNGNDNGNNNNDSEGCDVYTGDWKDGRQHGRGIFVFSNGSVYEGEFRKGLYCGEGCLEEGGGCYSGDFLDGVKHGVGHQRWRSGAEYYGEWKNGMMEGLGVYIGETGLKYEGGFKNGLRHGFGAEEFGNKKEEVFVCPLQRRHRGNNNSVCTYEGNYHCGYFDGVGLFRCEDGCCYEGEFRHGNKHGEGKQTYNSVNNNSVYGSQEYAGRWNNNKKEGQGCTLLKDGNCVEGEFVDGQPHGLMTHHFKTTTSLTSATTTTVKAEYKHGYRLRWLKESKTLIK